MEETAVVMICGPHHHKLASDGQVLCRSFHQGTRCFARIDHATLLAKWEGFPLIIAGDANGGMDVDRYVAHARAYGVQAFPCVWAEPDPPASNTLLDVRMAVETLLQSTFTVREFILVTDEWHMPRAYLLAFLESLRLCTEAGRPQYVVQHNACPRTWEPPVEMLAREAEGVLAIAAGTYGQLTDTYIFGKPVLEMHSRTG